MGREEGRDTHDFIPGDGVLTLSDFWSDSLYGTPGALIERGVRGKVVRVAADGDVQIGFESVGVRWVMMRHLPNLVQSDEKGMGAAATSSGTKDACLAEVREADAAIDVPETAIE